MHKLKQILVAQALVILVNAVLSLFSPAAWGWESKGHDLITKNAIQLLPNEMKGFYETNSRYLVAFSMLPDDWRHTHYQETFAQHFIDLDLHDKPPFDRIRTDRTTAEKRFGKEAIIKGGILPWTIEERYAKLIDAFKSEDMEEVVLQSSVLSHFVGDAHVPFHATKDYDGKTPEQKGLHFRWESNMVVMYIEPESVKPNGPTMIGDSILESAFDWCVDSYGYVDAICEAEDVARTKDPTHGYNYCRIIHEKTGDIASKRLSQAAEALAGTWISAWKAAGSPDLKDKAAPIFWGR